jgi:integrase/recombinase XerD
MKNLPLNNYAYKELELDYKEWLALLGYAENTVYNMPLYMHEFFHWLEQQGIKHVQSITAEHVHAFLFQLKERPHAVHGGKLSPAHINKYHQGLVLLSQFVRQTDKGSFTVETERLEQTREVPDILTAAEVKALYHATDASVLGLRDKVMLDIFYGCGLRRNEGVHLDVSDIDFKGKLVYVRRGKNYKERYVPASEMILQHIHDYLDHSRPFLQKKDKTPALFISDKGYRAQGQSLLIRLRKLTKLSRVNKQIGLHTLRHSIATHLLQGGMKLKHIATFLGHSSLESTQIYTHVSADRVRQSYSGGASFNEGGYHP